MCRGFCFKFNLGYIPRPTQISASLQAPVSDLSKVSSCEAWSWCLATNAVSSRPRQGTQSPANGRAAWPAASQWEGFCQCWSDAAACLGRPSLGLWSYLRLENTTWARHRLARSQPAHWDQGLTFNESLQKKGVGLGYKGAIEGKILRLCITLIWYPKQYWHS